jgi:signal transduction histidine kinase
MVVGTLERDVAVSVPRRSIGVPRSSTLVRLAAIAALVSVVAVLAVGVILANAAQNDLLGARAATHQTIVDGFVEEGLLPVSDSSFDALDRAVDLRLLGGETVRVKLWDRSGVVVYSDVDDIIGQAFEIGDNVTRALSGATVVEVDDLEALENVAERSLGGLIEYYLPIAVDGRVAGAFEIYEESSAFTASLDELKGHVWTAVGIGVGAIAIAFAAVAAGWIVASDRKRRLAEALLGEVLTAGDDERRRILGSLHDDIGQPLYRVLYGLEGSCARISDPDVRAELAILEELVRGIDGALRTELRVLHAGLVEGDDLRAEAVAMGIRLGVID